MTTLEFWAILATTILAALTVFQLALIAKAPLGEYAWGGQHRVLPPKLRIASIASIVLYIIFAWFALAKSGVITSPSGVMIDVTLWIFFGYFVVGIIMNTISRSKKERMVMTPVAVVLAIAFFFLALG